MGTRQYQTSSFSKRYEAEQKALAKAFPKEQRKDPKLDGVMLVASKVEMSSGQWVVNDVVATVYSMSSAEWTRVSGGKRRAVRGQAAPTKPSLNHIMGQMAWMKTADGATVGLLKHFLQAMTPGKSINPAQRARTYNAMLRDEGCQGRVYQKKVRNLTGKAPWVASKITLRSIYKHL